MKYFLGLICQKVIGSKDYGRKKSQNDVAVGRSEGFLGNPGENLVGEDCRWSEGIPRDAIIKYHQRGGLKQEKLILSQF